MYLSGMENTTVPVWFSLGSNLGDRLSHLQAAVDALHDEKSIQVIRISPIYKTEAWGNTNQPDFFNCVIEARTNLAPEQVLTIILETERKLGRIRNERWGPRTIDIDILLMGQLTHTSDQLILPHPELHRRLFVLIPLADLSPDLLHPIEQKTIRDLVEQCTDRGEVHTIISDRLHLTN